MSALDHARLPVDASMRDQRHSERIKFYQKSALLQDPLVGADIPRNTEAEAQLRDEGRDPSHGGEAARKRAATVAQVKRREWMMLTIGERRRRTTPAGRARWLPSKLSKSVD